MWKGRALATGPASRHSGRSTRRRRGRAAPPPHRLLAASTAARAQCQRSWEQSTHGLLAGALVVVGRVVLCALGRARDVGVGAGVVGGRDGRLGRRLGGGRVVRVHGLHGGREGWRVKGPGQGRGGWAAELLGGQGGAGAGEGAGERDGRASLAGREEAFAAGLRSGHKAQRDSHGVTARRSSPAFGSPPPACRSGPPTDPPVDR